MKTASEFLLGSQRDRKQHGNLIIAVAAQPAPPSNVILNVACI